MSTAGRLAFIGLTAMAAASWWLNAQLGAPEAVEERPVPEGFYMSEAEITTPGADGLPRYRLVADEIRQRALGGPTLLREVRLEYNLYSSSPWLLTAPEGELSADQELLELWGGVEVIGDSGEHGRTTLSTPRLQVDTETHVARTEEAVDLSLGAQQLSAVGMVAHLLEERLQLQSQVHGRFLP